MVRLFVHRVPGTHSVYTTITSRVGGEIGLRRTTRAKGFQKKCGVNWTRDPADDFHAFPLKVGEMRDENPKHDEEQRLGVTLQVEFERA